MAVAWFAIILLHTCAYVVQSQSYCEKQALLESLQLKLNDTRQHAMVLEEKLNQTRMDEMEIERIIEDMGKIVCTYTPYFSYVNLRFQ